MDRDLTWVLDVWQSAHLVQEFVQGVDEAAFMQDRLRQSAVIRQIEVIGEAVRRISPAFRALYPSIPWQAIVGMRSKLLHEYDRVDLTEVWNVIQRDIPDLIQQIAPLIPPDEPDNE